MNFPRTAKFRIQRTLLLVALLGTLPQITNSQPPSAPTEQAPESPAKSAPGDPVKESDAPFTNSLGMKFVPVPGTTVYFSIWETRVQDYKAYADEKKVFESWKDFMSQPALNPRMSSDGMDTFDFTVLKGAGTKTFRQGPDHGCDRSLMLGRPSEDVILEHV